MKALGLPAEVIDMKDYDPDDQLADEVSQVQREDVFSSCSKEAFFCLISVTK